MFRNAIFIEVMVEKYTRMGCVILSIADLTYFVRTNDYTYKNIFNGKRMHKVYEFGCFFMELFNIYNIVLDVFKW